MGQETSRRVLRFPEELLTRFVTLRPGELRVVLQAAAWSALVLCAYYILRPLREEIGSEHRSHLAMAWRMTFIGVLCALPLHGWLLSRLPRKAFVPLCQRFFALNLILFWALLRFLPDQDHLLVELAFYVWTSVFNLLVVTITWSLLVDLFSHEAAQRLFGFIAAGGTGGALLGSLLTSTLAPRMEPVHLLLLAAVFLEFAARLARLLAGKLELREADLTGLEQQGDEGPRTDVEGGVVSGLLAVMRSPYLLLVCGYLCFFTLAGTFAYFEQAEIVREAFSDRAERTAFFANVNLMVSMGTCLLQAFVTAQVIRRLGVGATLAVLPLVAVLGFAALGFAPILPILVAFQVLRRTANFALAKPARELLFTVVGREEKYRSKAFIDTVIYRGGDVAWSTAFDVLNKTLALGISAIAFLAVPPMMAWAALAFLLGRRHERRVKQQESPCTTGR